MANERNGRVISSDGGLYGVYTDDGRRVLCKPRGKFRHEKLRLLVGDRVTLEEDEQGNPCVGKISERRNALIRPPFANLDMLCIAVAAACPDPILPNVDKLTAICEENHIVPLVVLTKCDLAPEKAEEISAIYASVGYRVFQTSSLSGGGIEALRSFLTNDCEGLVSAFAGASGAGKSTLLNALFPSLSLRTGEVSLRIGRGKNTTRAVNLFPYAELPGGGSGFIADTPGFSLLDFENFDFFGLDDLPYNFPEFVPCLGHCRYTKCTHRREDGCLVIEKVNKGLIAPSRHESYCLLYDQLKNKHEWDKRS